MSNKFTCPGTGLAQRWCDGWWLAQGCDNQMLVCLMEEDVADCPRMVPHSDTTNHYTLYSRCICHKTGKTVPDLGSECLVSAVPVVSSW